MPRRMLTLEEAYDLVKEHRDELIEQHNAGNKAATDVITWYEMHRKCPGDPGAQALLTEYLLDYLSAKES